MNISKHSTSTLSPVEAYIRALREGRLMYQHCACGQSWLPPRFECPQCLRSAWSWREACGTARLVSWVVYNVAYDETLKNKLPYNVAIVELDEGVRLISNIIGTPDGDGLVADMRLALVLEREGDHVMARFKRAEDLEMS